MSIGERVVRQGVECAERGAWRVMNLNAFAIAIALREVLLKEQGIRDMNR